MFMNSSSLMCKPDSSRDHLPPVVVDPLTAPYPSFEESVVSTISGWG